MILIQNIDVYAPEPLGKKDVFIAGGRIEYAGEEFQAPPEICTIIDGSGKILIPGLIDSHVHVTGGGGEGGMTTRADSLPFTALLKGGVTTVLGMLGTDGTTRSIEELLAKIKGINELGLTAFGLTGSYEYPPVTLTGSVQKDIVFLSEIIGAKTAVSDHRSSHLSNHELIRLASQVRTGGMIGGKAGALVVHLGTGKQGLTPVFDALEQSDLPVTVFRPTHLNRNAELLKSSREFLKRGGWVDYTCKISSDHPPAKVIRDLIKKHGKGGLDLSRVTVSSDGWGSYSSYDSDGAVTRIGLSSVSALLTELKDLVLTEKVPLDQALPFFTTNPAAAMGLPMKGSIRRGCDADLLLMNKSLEIETVIARGKILLDKGKPQIRIPFSDESRS